MKVSYDEAKRLEVLSKRGLDFRDAEQALLGVTLTRSDDRADYGEDRFVTLAECNGTIVLIVWTPRDGQRRIVTMWKASRSERARYFEARKGHGRP